MTKTTTKFDSIYQEVYLNLWRTYDRLRLLEDELFAAYGLTCQQYNVLRILRSEYPKAIPTLAIGTRLVSRAPDITRMLDRLADAGWIERTRPEDNRRTVLVKITPTGIELIKTIREPLKQCHISQLGHLSESELVSLCKVLRSVRSPHESDESPWK